MKNFKNLLMVALFFASVTIIGQTRLTGTVVDESNEPLPGASVIVKGTSKLNEAGSAFIIFEPSNIFD